MKSRIHWNWSLGLALVALPFLGAHTQESLSQATDNAPTTTQPTNTTPALLAATNPAPALQPETAPQAVAPTVPPEAPAQTNAQAAALAEPPAEVDLVNAPVTPVSAEKTLPTNLKLASPTTEIVKLANSGVDESVMLAFVTNSIRTFNLGADDIIYLNDIGVSGTVVTAMIQRDQAIKQLAANAAPAPAQPAPTEQAAATAPAEPEPQPAPPAETYAAPAASEYAVFYDSLAPYGTWVDVGGYGVCWQPTVVVVNPGWRPYCHGGRWVYSDCGWYWMSSYSWGWAPFHYGRWFCHAQRGWCWAPGNVWGPSWVSWRYNGNYCGWAPLPPAAGFSVGVGLTYRGQYVSSSFSFGLGVNSYSFVAAGDFHNHHLDRYAVPPQHATRVYHQTVPSTTIDGNHSRVVNHGIPPSYVAGGSRSQSRPLGIRATTTPTAPGDRRERFDRNNRDLVVYRPHFPPPNATPPTSTSRPQTELGRHSQPDPRRNSSGSAFTPATQHVAPTPPSRSVGETTATQSSPSGRSQRGSGGLSRPDTYRNSSGSQSAPAPATRNVAPTPPSRSPSGTPPTRPDSPSRSRPTPDRSGPATVNPRTPSSSFTVIGRREGSQRQTLAQPSTPATESSRSQPPAPQQNVISRPSPKQNPQSFRIAEAPAQAPAQSHSSTPRTTSPSARSEQPRSFTAPPSHSAPVQVPRAAPAPAPAPSPARSHSTPSVSSAPRTDIDTSQSSRSSFSAPPSRSGSGSGKNQR